MREGGEERGDERGIEGEIEGGEGRGGKWIVLFGTNYDH